MNARLAFYENKKGEKEKKKERKGNKQKRI